MDSPQAGQQSHTETNMETDHDPPTPIAPQIT